MCVFIRKFNAGQTHAPAPALPPSPFEKTEQSLEVVGVPHSRVENCSSRYRERRVQDLCESRGGRPGLSVLMSLTVSVDVKQHWAMLRRWSQFVPNLSTWTWSCTSSRDRERGREREIEYSLLSGSIILQYFAERERGGERKNQQRTAAFSSVLFPILYWFYSHLWCRLQKPHWA